MAPQFTGHERFTPVHAALLVFALDGTGYFLVRATEGDGRWPKLVWIPFLALSAHGGWLLALQRRTGRNYLLFGVLLTAVNLGWAFLLTVRSSVEEQLRRGFLVTAGALIGLGIGVAVQACLEGKRPKTGA